MFTRAKARITTGAALLVAAMAILAILVTPAHALDFTGGCGIAGQPVTGWNGNTDVATRTEYIECGTSKSFTVQFNAKLTQDDINAGGLKWKLVASGTVWDDMLLEATVACAKLAALAVGTDLVCEAKFTLKCVEDPPCTIEGVSLDKIEIKSWPGLKNLCSEKAPAATTGSTTGSASLALEDVPGGGNEDGCNKLIVVCTTDKSLCSWDGPRRARSGEAVTTALVSATPVFSPATTVGFGLEGGITQADYRVVSPQRLEVTLLVPPGFRPAVLPVEVYDAEGVIEVDPFVVDPAHWAHHTLGNAELTVTDRGVIGYLDAEHTLGTGFVYPSGWENQLYIGGFWLAHQADKPMNRDYAAEPAAEWMTGPAPDDALAFSDYGPPRETLRGVFTDGADGLTPTVRVEQVSRSDLDADFVYLRYRVQNLLPVDQAGFYAGLFADLDVTPDAGLNVGGTDPVFGLAWVGNGDDLFVGIVTIPTAGAPAPLANVTLIPNALYVWPSQYLHDEDRSAFLRRSDELHHLPEAADPGDYSALVSVGPLSLPAGESFDVVYALVGGTSMGELKAHAEQARLRYPLEQAGVDPGGVGPGASGPALRIQPNPFRSDARISFRLDNPGPIDLSVFDVAGRLVRKLAAGRFALGTHEFGWDGLDEAGRGVPGSIYFVRLSEPGGGRTMRMVRLK